MPEYFTAKLAVFEVGLELSKILPLKEVAVSAFNFSVNLLTAKEYREQGSDITVEADLAAVFGRGHIDDALLNEWQRQLLPYLTKAPHIRELFTISGHKSRVELHDTPSIVALRAAKETTRMYKGSIITLSMLSYFHKQNQLAYMISNSLQIRMSNGEVNPSDPGASEIANSLRLYAADTSLFDWSKYKDAVLAELWKSIPGFQYTDSLVVLTPSLLLAAMDFLYVVQRFPEDKKISVSAPSGCIPLIIWAHHILGLNVTVLHHTNVQVHFKRILTQPSHVLIEWPLSTFAEDNDEFSWDQPAIDVKCVVRLLEADRTVSIGVSPKDSERDEIIAEERHPLRGYCTSYLSRILNSTTLISKSDPIWAEFVSIAVGFSLHLSQRLVREMDFHTISYDPRLVPDSAGNASSEIMEAPESGEEVPEDTRPAFTAETPSIQLNAASILGAARLLFTGGHRIDIDQVNAKAAYILRHGLHHCMSQNSTIMHFIQKLNRGSLPSQSLCNLLKHLTHLAKLVIAFAHVAQIETYCPKESNENFADIGNMQLILRGEGDFLHFNNVELAIQDPLALVKVDPVDAFHSIVSLLSSSVLTSREDKVLFGRSPRRLYLCSDSGWSIFLDAIGDKDPGEVRPELIHIQRGVPVDKDTRHRKFRIRDGYGFASVSYPEMAIEPITDSQYEPRGVAKAMIQQFWRIGRDDFENSLYFRVRASEEWGGLTGVTRFEEVAGFRLMHESIWQVYTAPACPCDPRTRNSRPVAHCGSDAAVVLGWSESVTLPSSARTLIFLTKGCKRVRWLAVLEATQLRQHEGQHSRPRREVMLRTPESCEDCALAHVVSRTGNWILII